jgi:hypothetical protein
MMKVIAKRSYNTPKQNTVTSLLQLEKHYDNAGKDLQGFSIHPIPIAKATKAAPRHSSPSARHNVGWAFFLATGVQDIVFVDDL